MKKPKPIRWNTQRNATANAREVLPGLAERFLAAGRKAAAPKAAPRDLHLFRLEAKRFRYTLELFRPIYGPGMDRKLSLLRAVQQCLGDMNDCMTTRALVETEQPRPNPQVRALLERLDQHAGEKRAEFVKLWAQSFDGEQNGRRWTTYLERFAGRGLRKQPRKASRA